MKIALLGEYSNVHHTLSLGLKELGHETLVVSDGDGWKNYPRDISLIRKSHSLADSIMYYIHTAKTISEIKGFDVVQLINPMFLLLKAERIYSFYKKLRKNNGKIFLGAFGMDKYWVKAGMDCKTFRYSDFNLGSEIRKNPLNTIYCNDWLWGSKGKLNDYIAKDCDGIISGLYEYDASYRPYFNNKLKFIPFPIDTTKQQAKIRKVIDGKIKFFIGIQKQRNAYKGTDIMLNALKRIKQDYHDRCEITIAESMPFKQYVETLDNSHVILDQLYSYTPAMNALQAMWQGLVVVGGGEEENYTILGEKELRPIINVLPNEQDVYLKLENIINKPEQIEILSKQGIEYINRYHNKTDVAQQYVEFYNNN